jgi:hypothetical protein
LPSVSLLQVSSRNLSLELHTSMQSKGLPSAISFTHQKYVAPTLQIKCMFNVSDSDMCWWTPTLTYILSNYYWSWRVLSVETN